MTIDDLQRRQSEIRAVRRNAEQCKTDAKVIADMRIKMAADGKIPFSLGQSAYGGGLASQRESHNKNERDAVFAEVLLTHGPDLFRLTEMKLLAMSRERENQAKLLQAQLDQMLAAAASLETPEPEPAP